MHPTTTALLFLGSYLIGCCTFGYYLVICLTGRDIREMESGNVGSRNVGRVLGAKGFLLTLTGDAGKGMLAVWLARHFFVEPWAGHLALIGATCGHIWPVQLRFRGGKGLATLAGGLALLQPALFAATLALCALLYPLLRGTTKAGLMALALSPLLMIAMAKSGMIAPAPGETALFALLATIVLFAHRSNIVAAFGTTFTRGNS
ncbi:glycerol-3-phosphate acyltransferase [Geomonas sp. Red32]|uniref:glycerol-3-phosphate acyltransferase n=1 Tax=Geomonas sp. Red32 TaxID=2912856 RepID=UPI00202CCD15|nr:glycerol-3-phosphate acyltransferase [Geomonas sp. Red32]MCM0081835.1 glycerol-3-phosphate acyltransferase [Geomonas sp. Red32]